MGSSVSQEELAQMPSMFEKIMGIPCPVLDVGESEGATGYIDYILQSEVSSAISKGTDAYQRDFIVWKARVIVQMPGKPDYVYSTFSTFFQRYADSSSRVYHICGHDGRNLFRTEGGASLAQMEFLYNFLSKGYAELDYSQAETLRIEYPYTILNSYSPEEINAGADELKREWIFKIVLVDKFAD